jgi:hypothetical protein
MAFELLAPAWPVITAVRNCNVHDDGATVPVEVCIDLGLGDQAHDETSSNHGDNVEPRRDGVIKLEMDMTRDMDPLTVNGGNVQVICPSGFAPSIVAYLQGTQTVVVEFWDPVDPTAPLPTPDRDCCQVGLGGMTSTPPESYPVSDTWFVAGLQGDANQNGAVDPLDFAYISLRLGMSGAAQPEADVNLNNQVDPLDFAFVSLRLGRTLPGPCP